MVRAGSVSLTRWSAYVLLLFNQLIGFVNDSIRSFFFARADCRTNPALCDHLASHIASVKDLRGKRLAINTFGSSADFAIYQLLSRIGLDLNKDVTLLSVAGSPDARFAALIGGSVGDQCRIGGKTLEARPSGSMLSTARSLTPISRYPRRWSKMDFPGYV